MSSIREEVMDGHAAANAVISEIAKQEEKLCGRHIAVATFDETVVNYLMGTRREHVHNRNSA